MKISGNNFWAKFRREGPNLIGIGLFIDAVTILWIFIGTFVNPDVLPNEPISNRFISSSDPNGILGALFIIGIFVILIGTYFHFTCHVIYEEPWGLRFTKKRGNYFLTIIKGSVGLYELTIQLTKEERANYWREGLPFIKKLAANLNDKPNNTFKDRLLKDPVC